MKIELLHPIVHGDGPRTVEYGRGVYQTDNPHGSAYIPPALATEFLAVEDSHSGQAIAREYSRPTPPEGRVAEVSRSTKTAEPPAGGISEVARNGRRVGKNPPEE